MLPETIDYKDLGLDVPDATPLPTARDWFAKQSPAQQSKMMGARQFDAYKNASTALLSSAKTTSGAEIAANTEYNLGTLNATNLYLAAGDTLRIQVTKNGTPTDLSGAKIVFQAHLRKDLA